MPLVSTPFKAIIQSAKWVPIPALNLRPKDELSAYSCVPSYPDTSDWLAMNCKL
jgi:hypothetical protein